MRRAIFGLSNLDDANLNRIRFSIREDVPNLVDAFYAHLRGLGFDARITGAQVLERLRASQRDYLMTLGFDSLTDDYVQGRFTIGGDHKSAGLAPTWYLGAHAMLFGHIAHRLYRHHKSTKGVESEIVTLQRILAFDAHLIAESYARA